MLPYQVYVLTTSQGLDVDVFLGVFVYFEQKVEDTRAKFGSSVGAIGTFLTNNRDELMNHSVSIHVPFGCFLVLRADVLRSIVFEGNEMFLCFWINNGEGLQTMTKNMDTIIPYDKNCSDCLNGCPISTTKKAFTTAFHNNYGEKHLLTNRVPIQGDALQHLKDGGAFDNLGNDDNDKRKESKKSAALTSKKKKALSKNHRPTIVNNTYGQGKEIIPHHLHSQFLDYQQKMMFLRLPMIPKSMWWLKKCHRQKKERNKSRHPTMSNTSQNLKVL